MKTLLQKMSWLLGGAWFACHLLAQVGPGPGDPDGPVVPLVTLKITEPANGDTFEQGAEITIKATAVSSGGGITRLDFLADGQFIGVSEIFTLAPIPPGEPVYHEFVWTHADPGPHVLRVRAQTGAEFPTLSEPVTITVGGIKPVASVKLVLPTDLAEFRVGEDVEFKAEATDPRGFLPVVDFYANGEKVGTSSLTLCPVCIAPPCPCDPPAIGTTLIHQFLWAHPPEGKYVLEARAVTADGAVVVSESVRISVSAPVVPQITLKINRPFEGMSFQPGADIMITATAVSSTAGGITRLVFLADGQQIGVSEIATLVPVPPGEPVNHQFVWKDAPLGRHTLTVAARGYTELPVVSEPVHIAVRTIPTVSLELLDGELTEGPSGDQDSGEVLLRRTGSTDEPLTVYIGYSGTATPGVDYGPVNHSVVLKAGASQARISLYGLVDALEEGDESIEVSILLPPTAVGMELYNADPDKRAVKLTLHDSPVTRPPVVFVEAVQEWALEHPNDAAFVAPIAFRISRSGGTNSELRVFYHLGGHAKAGEDYTAPTPGGSVLIPAGEHSAQVLVIPVDDHLSEGTEDVLLSLDHSPAAGPVEPYRIDEARQHATAYIYDDEPWLSIVQPLDHSWFAKDAPITIRALTVSSNEYVRHLDFYADGGKIGESTINFLVPPKPGAQVFHEFAWSGAPEGTHHLTMRTTSANGDVIESLDPVTVVVGDPGTLSVVSLELTDGTATEPTGPNALLDPLVVTLHREGDVSRSLTVSLDTFGEASRFSDYRLEPEDGDVTFAAGQREAKLYLYAKLDNLVEGAEKVGIELNGPACGDGEAYCYLVGQPASVEGVIRDPRTNALPIVTVSTLSPYALEGDVMNYGEFLIERTGDLSQALTVDFSLSGAAQRGADYRLVQDPCPFCDRLEIEIEGNSVTIPPGSDSVRVGVYAAFDGILTVVEPVLESVVLQVHVPLTPGAVGVPPPYVVGTPDKAELWVVDRQHPDAAELIFIRPTQGTELAAGKTHKLQVIAVDPGGSIRRVEFYGNDQLLGVSEILTKDVDIPGKLRFHEFAWNSPADLPSGDRVLQAAAKDSGDNLVKSQPVKVKIDGAESELPTVTIVANKTPAHENGDLRSRIGSYLVTRKGGPGNAQPLYLFAQVKGTAALGLDYRWPQRSADPAQNAESAQITPGFGAFIPIQIPAGADSVSVLFEALPDELKEETETVTLRLIDPPILALNAGILPIPPTYLIGEPAEATVEIIDDTVVRAEITLVVEGTEFRTGATVRMTAKAVHPEYGVEGIEFSADGQVIGMVPYCCDVCDCLAAPKGVPFSATFEWKEVPAGIHRLTARALIRVPLVSEPVTIRVGGSARASLAIVAPTNGAAFKLGETITIDTVGQLDGSLVSTVDFYANGNKIGSRCLLCVIDAIIAPGTPLHNVLDWKPEKPGSYVLTAVGQFGADLKVASAPVVIRVAEGEPKARLTITQPENGATVRADQTFTVIASGVGRYGGITDVVLLVDGQRAAESHIRFFRAPEADEEVLHEFSIRLGVGRHVLVVQDLSDPAVKSPPVEVIATEHGPSITWVTPEAGATFKAGQVIPLEVVAVDPNGLIYEVEFLDGDHVIGKSIFSCLTCRLAPGAPITHHLDWSNAPAGDHVLRARSVGGQGTMVVSEPRSIKVEGGSTAEPFVTRDLPDGYQAGVKFTVRLDAKPGDGVTAYVVEEKPPFTTIPRRVPRGSVAPPQPYWTVQAISHDGVFDQATGKVKFGPFTDHQPRTLTYEVVPTSVVAVAEFDGIASADGVSSRIGGERLLQSSMRHPADRDPGDFIIKADELTAYAAAWKNERPWPLEPSPIPVDYVTRASALWKGGERYWFNPGAGEAPRCWVNTQPFIAPGSSGADSAPHFTGTAVRTRTVQADGSVRVTIRVLAAPGAQAIAIEEHLSADGTVSDIFADGTWSPASRTLRWGPFFAGVNPTVGYVVTGGGEVNGVVSFDGWSQPVRGNDDNSGGPEGAGHLLGLDALPDGSVQVSLESSELLIGAEFDLEVSTDLKVWSPAGAFAPEQSGGFAHDASSEGEVRFYRAVRKQ